MSRLVSRRSLLAVVVVGAVAAVPLACGGGQTRTNLFSNQWTDDGGKSVETARARIGSDKPRPGADVVVGVSASGDRLLGIPLGGGTRWAFRHALDARPTVAGEYVIGSGGGEVFALDARTGTRLWARPTGGLAMRGAGADGNVTVVTFAQEGGRGSVLLAVARDGAVVRQIETERELGIPAVVSGYAFVPWAGQYVTILDLSDGSELGRVLVREKTSRAFAAGGAIYFGEIGLYRFDEKTKLASQNRATHLSIPSRPLAGAPLLFLPGTERVGVEANARDKVRIFVRPAPRGQDVGFQDERMYATYFRLVTAFAAGEPRARERDREPRDDAPLAWVHAHPADVLAGAAASGGFIGCDARGQVFSLDAKTGAKGATAELGEPLKSCVVHVDAHAVSAPAAAAAPLPLQIEEALGLHEDELLAAQELLVRELAHLPDERATTTLLSLLSDPRAAPALARQAREALAHRKSGAAAMKQVLARRYDFLHGVLTAPPVAACARALAAMNETSASGLLAAHLLEPASTDEDVREAALALEKLAQPSDANELRRFFSLYRGVGDSDDVARALSAVATAYVRVGGDEARATVNAAQNDGLTAERHRDTLATLLAPTSPNPTSPNPTSPNPSPPKK